MILSEFAGAAQSLNGSILVNPWDVQSTADAIAMALDLSKQQRHSNWQKLWAVSERFFPLFPSRILKLNAVCQQVHVGSMGCELHE